VSVHCGDELSERGRHYDEMGQLNENVGLSVNVRMSRHHHLNPAEAGDHLTNRVKGAGDDVGESLPKGLSYCCDDGQGIDSDDGDDEDWSYCSLHRVDQNLIEMLNVACYFLVAGLMIHVGTDLTRFLSHPLVR